mgnify:CR=1 FL=1
MSDINFEYYLDDVHIENMETLESIISTIDGESDLPKSFLMKSGYKLNTILVNGVYNSYYYSYINDFVSIHPQLDNDVDLVISVFFNTCKYTLYTNALEAKRVKYKESDNNTDENLSFQIRDNYVFNKAYINDIDVSNSIEGDINWNTTGEIKIQKPTDITQDTKVNISCKPKTCVVNVNFNNCESFNQTYSVGYGESKDISIELNDGYRVGHMTGDISHTFKSKPKVTPEIQGMEKSVKFWGDNIWKMNDNIYYSSGKTHWELKDGVWLKKQWSGIEDFNGRDIWSNEQINGYIYSAGEGNQYAIYNGDIWYPKEWTYEEYCKPFGKCVWKADGVIYHSSGWKTFKFVNNYEWWDEPTGTTHHINTGTFEGSDVWEDNNGKIYYSAGDDQYVHNSDGWEIKVWGDLKPYWGMNVWHTGNKTYYSFEGTHYELIDGKWEIKRWDTDKSPKYGSDIWEDNNGNVYYSTDTEQYKLVGNSWVDTDWKFVITVDNGSQVWRDNDGHTYYSKDEVQLERIGGKWVEKKWKGLDSFCGRDTWIGIDGTLYYSGGWEVHYELDNDEWKQIEWKDSNNHPEWGNNVWRDNDGHVYYSHVRNTHYNLEMVGHDEWQLKNWTKYIPSGSDVWRDNDGHVYYSSYELIDGKWAIKEWNKSIPYGIRVWSMNNKTYYSSWGTHYELIDGKWAIKEWDGKSDFSGEYIWTDGKYGHYAYNGVQYKIQFDTHNISYNSTDATSDKKSTLNISIPNIKSDIDINVNLDVKVGFETDNIKSIIVDGKKTGSIDYTWVRLNNSVRNVDVNLKEENYVVDVIQGEKYSDLLVGNDENNNGVTYPDILSSGGKITGLVINKPTYIYRLNNETEYLSENNYLMAERSAMLKSSDNIGWLVYENINDVRIENPLSRTTIDSTDNKLGIEKSSIKNILHVPINKRVTSLFEIFKNCTSMENINTEDWDTSKVTTMYNMFNGCNTLNINKDDGNDVVVNLDLSSVDTSSVVGANGMKQMFTGCNKLRNIKLSEKFFATSSPIYFTGPENLGIKYGNQHESSGFLEHLVEITPPTQGTPKNIQISTTLKNKGFAQVFLEKLNNKGYTINML